MRWGSIQAVQQLDRFVQCLRGVRQEQTPLIEPLTHPHLMKLEAQSYPDCIGGKVYATSPHFEHHGKVPSAGTIFFFIQTL